MEILPGEVEQILQFLRSAEKVKDTLRSGYTTDTWEFTRYLDNLTDERPVVCHSTGSDIVWRHDNITTGTPRTLGMSVRRYF